jgi:hypothetical protein
MTEEELANHIKNLQNLKKQDANIDVASLAMSALATQQDSLLSSKEKRWAYIISLSLPPLGLLFALKFYFSGKSDGKSAAYLCIAITAISIVIAFAFMGVLIKSSGLSTEQFQQAPQQLRDDIGP